jgi:trk system potassium uptake protein TrkA
MASLKRGYVVIVGCGRLGSHLAETFSAAGSAVVVIDQDAGSFERLSSDFSGFTIEADAAELAVLERAKTSAADLFVAASARENLNIFTALVARHHFGVKEVIARIEEPESESIYNQLGIRTFCPTTLSVEHLLKHP